MKRTFNRIRSSLLCLALTLLLVQPGAGADLADKKELTLEVVKNMVAAAESYASKQGWKVCIAVVDPGGYLLYFQRADDVQLGSVEVAIRKARSAAMFRRPSKAFNDRIPEQPQVMMVPDAFALEGGVPITHDGQFLGAIGVSGASNPEDGMVAQAGVDALPGILER